MGRGDERAGMEDSWFTGFADELAECLVDAGRCADICERLLQDVQRDGDAATQKQVVDAVVAPTAVARVLIDMIEQPPEFVLAAARLCRDTSRDAAEALRGLDAAQAILALETCAQSCDRLLDAAR